MIEMTTEYIDYDDNKKTEKRKIKISIEAKCPECGRTHIITPFQTKYLSESAIDFMKKSICESCRTRRNMILYSRICSR